MAASQLFIDSSPPLSRLASEDDHPDGDHTDSGIEQTRILVSGSSQRGPGSLAVSQGRAAEEGFAPYTGDRP
jgi:hypothetical protein